jgi:hypothetical protein
MTMAIPVAKRVRDVFYKHRASGMIEHNATFVGMVAAELPYLLLMSVLYVLIYCATVSSLPISSITAMSYLINPSISFDRLAYSQVLETLFGSFSSSSCTQHHSLSLRNASCAWLETRRLLGLYRALG